MGKGAPGLLLMHAVLAGICGAIALVSALVCVWLALTQGESRSDYFGTGPSFWFALAGGQGVAALMLITLAWELRAGNKPAWLVSIAIYLYLNVVALTASPVLCVPFTLLALSLFNPAIRAFVWKKQPE